VFFFFVWGGFGGCWAFVLVEVGGRVAGGVFWLGL
jgi:hypothetical protein